MSTPLPPRGPRPLAADTRPDAERLLLDHYRGLEPREKVRLMCELGAIMERAAVRGIRERHPNATEHDVRLRLAALRYGAELTRRVWDWDPEVEGW